MGKPNRVPNKN